jgi:hypothetical protein
MHHSRILDGGLNQDAIDGRRGEDVIRGGFNTDEIEAADGEADDVDCGNEPTDFGGDKASIDEGLDTIHGCEVPPMSPRRSL